MAVLLLLTVLVLELQGSVKVTQMLILRMQRVEEEVELQKVLLQLVEGVEHNLASPP